LVSSLLALMLVSCVTSYRAYIYCTSRDKGSRLEVSLGLFNFFASVICILCSTTIVFGSIVYIAQP